MVLESITNPIFAKKHPFRLFLVGILFATILPSDLAETVFSAQLDTIKAINTNVAKLTGQAFDLSYGMEAFVMIFLNNVKVLLFCLFFAFFFGAGAIFILTWNASVISAAIGTYFRN